MSSRSPASDRASTAAGELAFGLGANAPQFAVLVAITALVGAMVGLERATLPLIGERDFGLRSSAAILSFLAGFGLAKAVANLAAGAFAERAGRRTLLLAGWGLALPVPVLIWVAPGWELIVAANVLLGVSQGLVWSMTVVMKVDLVGPRRRGLALGVNESAGYVGVAVAAAAGGLLAAELSAREALVAAGAAVAAAGFCSALLVRDTAGHATLEQGAPAEAQSIAAAFAAGTRRDSALRACSQAGLVNNLNDAVAWGLVPLYLAAAGASVGEIGLVAGVYPAVWGVGQIWAGAWSDRVGRRLPIVAGMLLQALALALLALSGGAVAQAAGAAAALGAGTALVYPTLIAAVCDRVAPVDRPSAVGVYRFWRDTGYVAGAAIAGIAADALGDAGAIWLVAALTALSGIWVAAELPAAITAVRPRARIASRA